MKPPPDLRKKPLGPPENGIVASHSATPAGRNTRPECEWYTPAEEWNEIRPASDNGEAVGGDGVLSDEVTSVEDTTDRHSRTSRSRKVDSVTTYIEVEDSRRETALVRSDRQRPNWLPPSVVPQQQPMRETPRKERVVERRPPVRERSRVEAEWIELDRTRRVPDLRKVESKKRVLRSVTISSGSERQ